MMMKKKERKKERYAFVSIKGIVFTQHFLPLYQITMMDVSGSLKDYVTLRSQFPERFSRNDHFSRRYQQNSGRYQQNSGRYQQNYGRYQQNFSERFPQSVPDQSSRTLSDRVSKLSKVIPSMYHSFRFPNLARPVWFSNASNWKDLFHGRESERDGREIGDEGIRGEEGVRRDIRRETAKRENGRRAKDDNQGFETEENHGSKMPKIRKIGYKEFDWFQSPSLPDLASRWVTRDDKVEMSIYIILALSTLGFVFQVWSVLSQYFAYDTVTVLSIIMPDKLIAPAVSICFLYPQIIDQNKLLQKYPSLEKKILNVTTLGQVLTIKEIFELCPQANVDGTIASCAFRTPMSPQLFETNMCDGIMTMDKFFKQQFVCYDISLVTKHGYRYRNIRSSLSSAGKFQEFFVCFGDFGCFWGF